MTLLPEQYVTPSLALVDACQKLYAPQPKLYDPDQCFIDCYKLESRPVVTTDWHPKKDAEDDDPRQSLGGMLVLIDDAPEKPRPKRIVPPCVQ